MRKILTAVLVLTLLLAFGVGCGKKEAEKPGKAPEAVKQAEAMDTTRMDSAQVDTGALQEGGTDTAAMPETGTEGGH